jgi:acetyl esterase
MKTSAFLIAITAFLAATATAQDAERANRAYPPDMPGAKVETYKVAGDTKLNLYVFQPADWKATDTRAAIVFFFGGGWTSGSPRQFVQQCEYLASRGMVAIAADYRVASRNHVQALECVKDAKSAIRYVRNNAARLGIDPNRIVAAGGSAGGHLAAACATIDEFDEPTEDRSVSSRPNALVLFNPALVLAPIEGITVEGERLAALEERMGTDPRKLSPYHHITAKMPPTVIFHGKADKVVPYETITAFAKAMKVAGNQCEVFGYDGQGHGFFNRGRGDNKMYQATLDETDKFLTQLGYLEKPHTVLQPTTAAETK